MAPKKQAVYFFALECKEKRGMKGTMRDVIEAVYTEWQAMTPTQKAPYERQAKETRESERLDRSFRATLPLVVSAGASSSAALAAISCDDPFYDAKIRREQTRIEIEKLLKGKNEETSLLHQPWYIIKFVTFCRCEVKEGGLEPYYVLGEVGIIEYSLKEGITASYHSFIKPNKIPMGYLSKCMDSSRDVHKIPLDGPANAELAKKTYKEIYQEICQFVSKKDSNNNWTRLFCMSEDYEETQFALEYLWRQAKAKGDYYPELHMLVSDLECLVLTLAHNQITTAQATEMLTKISYDYSSNTKCKFHEEESVLYCALGLVKRKAYLISDHLCPLHGVSVTPSHLPTETPVDTFVDDDMQDFRFKFRQVASGGRWKPTNSRRRDDYDQDQEADNRSGFECTYDIRYGRPKQESRDYNNSMQQQKQASQHQQQKRVPVADKFEQLSQVSMTTSTMTSRTATEASVSIIASTMTTGTTATATATATTMATRFRNSRQFEGNDLDEANEDDMSVTSSVLKQQPQPEKSLQQTQNESSATTVADKNEYDTWYPVIRPQTPSQQQQQQQQQKSTANAWSKPLNLDAEKQSGTGLANDDSGNRLKAFGRGRGRGISRF